MPILNNRINLNPSIYSTKLPQGERQGICFCKHGSYETSSTAIYTVHEILSMERSHAYTKRWLYTRKCKNCGRETSFTNTIKWEMDFSGEGINRKENTIKIEGWTLCLGCRCQVESCYCPSKKGKL